MAQLTTGQRIKEARTALSRRRGRKITQADLGRAVRVPKGTVAKWETDQQLPTGENLIALARALEVTPDQLLGTASAHEDSTPSYRHDAAPSPAERAAAYDLIAELVALTSGVELPIEPGAASAAERLMRAKILRSLLDRSG